MIRRTVPALAVLALFLAGCGGPHRHAAANPRFHDRSPATCQAHQSGRPGVDYRGGAHAAPALVLGMMRYYTSQGNQPYCDRQQATAADRDWARLYVTLGGAADHVSGVLG
jgi:hypothetical protein